MNPINDNTHYPVFEPNQTLSSSQLNQVFNYLDEQERLTRADLIGIGIVSGLDIQVDAAANTVKISKGCGITSAGYLIVQSTAVSFSSYKKYSPPKEVEYPPFYPPCSDGKPQKQTPYDLWEMVSNDEPGAKQFGSDPNFNLSCMAVVLFLELKKQDATKCTLDTCTGDGSGVAATLRCLLIGKKDLNAIIGAPLADYKRLSRSLAEIPIPRLAITASVDLNDYQNSYKKLFSQPLNGKTPVEHVIEAATYAGQILKTIIPDLPAFESGKLTSIFSSLPSTDVPDIQYYYDLLRDLTAGYHELRAAMLRQPAVCLPDGGIFSRHLALGVHGGDPAEGRTGYFPSPAVTAPENTADELRFLFDRLNQIVLNFDIPQEAKFKITPSIYGIRYLSGKSIPFYFKPDIRQFWDAAKKGERMKEILSWYDYTDSPDHVQNPLAYDLEPYNFFRVEGLIGKNIVDLKLSDPVKKDHLPFSVVYINADKPGTFLERHHAMEHQAGALRGGTLVVVHLGVGANTNIIVADFSLPYRVEQDMGCLGRVMVYEGEYEWFDSRKHLSNLAQREYRYPPRAVGAHDKKESQEHDKNELAPYYVVVVYRYEIQGQSLLSGGPVHVDVPIDRLVHAQLSAVAEKLNETFPGGVVFDHKAGSNKMLIRYFADHTFNIEWGGLQGNQIRYRYTNEGIYRWHNGTWEPLANIPEFRVAPRLRNEYRTDEYVLLQQDDVFDAEYPSPVPLATSQELIQWQRMIRKRAPVAIADLPIKEILSRIGHVINETYNVGGPVVNAVLVGSWANGSWVCRDGSKNLPKDFMALRQKVTGKTGSSDIDLLLDISDNAIKLDDVVNAIRGDEVIKPSGYDINILLGKKDAQKGLPLN